MSKASENTDRELYREVEGDYYANSIFVTEDGRIGMNVGGTVIVQPIAKWHRAVSDLVMTDPSAKSVPVESAKVTDTNDIDEYIAMYARVDVLADAKAALQNLIAQETNKARLEQTIHLQVAEQKFGKVDWQAAIYELEPREKIT